MKKNLREGFTTGTAAAAGAKAAAALLLGLPVSKVQAAGGSEEARYIDTPLPSQSDAPRKRLSVPLHDLCMENGSAVATIIKDGGDDPDATHKAVIMVHAKYLSPPEDAPGSIVLRGGPGVGRVTLPGLPVPPGEPAINPSPREQISLAVQEVLDLAGSSAPLEITIEVPDGERIARKTMNPRLGIVDGISILGTRGTVKPFSHGAWRATIRQGLSVARQAGLTDIAFTTGGRSERFFREYTPGWPGLGTIQAADFFRFSMEEAPAHGFTSVRWSVFFGKLVKHALRFDYTHAADSRLDFAALARWFADSGIRPETCEQTAQSVTAMGALEMIRDDPARNAALRAVMQRAVQASFDFALGRVDVAYTLFDFEGKLLDTLEMKRSDS